MSHRSFNLVVILAAITVINSRAEDECCTLGVTAHELSMMPMNMKKMFTCPDGMTQIDGSLSDTRIVDDLSDLMCCTPVGINMEFDILLPCPINDQATFQDDTDPKDTEEISDQTTEGGTDPKVEDDTEVINDQTTFDSGTDSEAEDDTEEVTTPALNSNDCCSRKHPHDWSGWDVPDPNLITWDAPCPDGMNNVKFNRWGHAGVVLYQVCCNINEPKFLYDYDSLEVEEVPPCDGDDSAVESRGPSDCCSATDASCPEGKFDVDMDDVVCCAPSVIIQSLGLNHQEWLYLENHPGLLLVGASNMNIDLSSLDVCSNSVASDDNSAKSNGRVGIACWVTLLGLGATAILQ